MKRKIELIFCIFLLALLSVPLLVFFGVPERFVRLEGVETEPELCPWSWSRWRSRSFQRTTEEYYAKKFFLRKTLMKIKNQLYDAVNLGWFHAGYSGSVIEGRNHVLYERGYLECYYAPHRVEEKRHRESLRLIRELFAELRLRGMEPVYVLAPDKAFLCPGSLPRYHRFYLKKQSEAPHGDYAGLLEKYRIPYFNAYDFLRRNPEKGPFFPVAGTHWNAKAAALTIEQVLTRLNADRPPETRFRIRTPASFREKRNRTTRYADNDIGKLLNLYYSPALANNIAYLPQYPDISFPANPGTVLVFGDSFSGQLAQIFRDSRMFGKVCNYLNRVPPAEELAQDVPDARLFLLVQTTPKLFEPRFSEAAIRQFLRTLQNLPLPGAQVRYFDRRRINVKLRKGFYRPENWGVWSGGQGSFEFPLPENGRAGRLLLRFRTKSRPNLKRTEFFYDGRRVAVCDFSGGRNVAQVELTPSSDRKTVTLSFRNYDPACPNRKDTRQLGLGFLSMEILPLSPAPVPAGPQKTAPR